MDMSNNVFAWFNSDLDGVGAAVLLGNMFPNFEYASTFFGDFLHKFEEWWKINENKYDKVFIVGIPLTQSLINKLDDHSIVFVSDIGDTLNVFDSTIINEKCGSCTKLLYKKFKEKIEFPKSLKEFFVYVNDYNSYDLVHNESKFINALYRKSGGNRFNKFVNRFWSGFDGFTNSEVKLCNKYFDDIDEELLKLDLYSGEFKKSKVLATFSRCSVNEISAVILDNHDCDVCIVVNLDTQYVSFRKKRGSTANVQFMAENLCDGGGSEFASGGKITQKFLDFTTKLTQL